MLQTLYGVPYRQGIVVYYRGWQQHVEGIALQGRAVLMQLTPIPQGEERLIVVYGRHSRGARIVDITHTS